MKKELFYTIALIIPILLLLSFPAWPVPGLINYQGKLTDPNGISLNGSYTMNFYLYNAESGGNTLWNEQQDVAVTNGIYNVELGKISSFPSDLFDNENLFLEIEIFRTDIDSETLSPRQRLTSTPFAMKAASSNIAGDAEKLDGKDSSEFGDGHSLDAVDGDPVDVLYVDSNGNVGIGTTNPGAKLDVKGDLAVDGFADFFGMNWNEKVGWKWNEVGWATVVDYSGSGVLVMVQGFNGHCNYNTILRITIDGVVWKDYTSGSGSVGANGWDIIDDDHDENAAIITLIPFKKFLTSLKVEIYNAASNAESGARVNYLTSVK